MKVVQFTIPVSKENTIVVQENILPHYYNHLHRHREVQIEWVVEGSGILIAGNYMQRFEAGEVYIIGANQSHIFKNDEAYFDPEEKKQVHSVSIFFDPHQLSQNLFSLPEMAGIRKFVESLHNGFQIPAAASDAIKKIIFEVRENKDSQRVAAFITLMHLFSVTRDMKPLASSNSEQLISEVEGIRMDQIFQYLVTNYKQHISLTEISEVANLTPQAFCRYFKKHTDKTFVSFLNEVRVNEACKIILSGRFDSFSNISYQTGFDNVTNFNRVFKKTIGKSPGEYYKEFRDRLV
ncbi:AraC family transcriptional regulator [Dyadobacter sediminis]|uniref:Helix-turn-helix domain-containing protein n=1 Tax=Dyadobacter sediminis TaxID=1493691 RepID=A0A5R9K8G6_9BACT|nr:AraC family transcriptional regulator [Dyadobacter sediminis]TLU90386.1 helix-turn-helix domain-containing protein [Dyadobacter sediminis]GGC07355.1 AraC family transcriptional regulator [Dyadobacter sediminis]